LFSQFFGSTVRNVCVVSVDDNGSTDSSTVQSLLVVLPLFVDFVWDNAKSKVTVLPPLYFNYISENCKKLKMLPLYISYEDMLNKENFTYYFPIYGTSTKVSDSGLEVYKRHFFLFPLFSRTISEDYSSVDILWPLIHSDSSDVGSSKRLLPIYWQFEDKLQHKSFTYLAPFYLSFSWKKAPAMVLEDPLLDESEPIDNAEQISCKIMFPFFASVENSVKGWSSVGSLCFLPPYCYSWCDKQTNKSATYVWPIYGHSVSNNQKSYFFCWPLIKYSTQESNDEVNKALRIMNFNYKQYELEDQSLYYSYSIFPIFKHTVDQDYEKETEMIKNISPLHWYTRTTTADAGPITKLSLLWAFHPSFSLFKLKRNKKKGNLVYCYPFFHYITSHDSTDLTGSLSVFWLFPGLPQASLVHLSNEKNASTIWLYSLFYSKFSDNGFKQVSMLWFYHPEISLIKWRKTEDEVMHYIHPFYYFVNQKNISLFSSLYFLHPELSLIKHKQVKGPDWLFDSLTQYIAFLYYYRDRRDPTTGEFITKYYSFLWFLHPRLAACKYELEPSSNYHKRYLFPVFYELVQDNSHRLSLFWFLHPRIALFKFYSNDTDSMWTHSIPLIYWYSNNYGETPFTDFGLFAGMFRYFSNETVVSHSLYSLYSYTKDIEDNSYKLSLFFGMVKFERSAKNYTHVWPLFKSETTKYKQEHSVLWLGLHPSLCIFRYFHTQPSDSLISSSGSSDNADRYDEDDEDCSTTLNRLWPIYYYSNTDSSLDSSDYGPAVVFNLGWLFPQASLFHYSKDPITGITTNFLWGIYHTTKDTLTNTILSFDALWLLKSLKYNISLSLLKYRPSTGDHKRKEMSNERDLDFCAWKYTLWPIVTYEHDSSQQKKDIRVLARLMRLMWSPQNSLFYLNPLVWYERDMNGTYTAILGGLIGRETFPNGDSKMRWLWVF